MVISKSRSLDTSRVASVLANRTGTTFQGYHQALLIPVAVRHCHCSALADSSSSATAAEQQHGSSSQEESPAAPVHASEVATEVLTGFDGVSTGQQSSDGVGSSGWSGFLQALWQRGYFDEHSSGKEM